MVISRRNLLIATSLSVTAGSVAALLPQWAFAAPDLDVIAWHNNTYAEHIDRQQQTAAAGYRMIGLSVYGGVDKASVRYAGVTARHIATPAQTWRNFMTAADLQAEQTRMAAQGWGPVLLSATGPADRAIFAGVWQPGFSARQFVVGIDPANLVDRTRKLRSLGLIPQCVAVFGTNDDPRFLLAARDNPAQDFWNLDICDATLSDAQSKFNAVTAGGGVPQAVLTGASDRISLLFTDRDLGAWDARANMSSAGYQTRFDQDYGQGLVPVQVAGQTTGEGTRFGAVFAQTDQPRPRQRTVSGPRANPAVDDAVFAMMEAGKVRGASLAVCLSTRLVYTRGYTLAAIGYPQITPTTYFRQASVGKMLTALLCWKLIEQGRLHLQTQIQDVLDLRTPTGARPSQEFCTITVEDLLLMRSRLNTSYIWGADPEVAAALGTTLPIDANQLTSWVAAQPLLAEAPLYNNIGFTMLGQVLTRVTGALNFLGAISQEVLAPLQLQDVRYASSLLSTTPPDEAQYHSRGLTTFNSVMTPDRPWVPSTYGDWNFFAVGGAGGLSAPTVSIARILANFSLVNAGSRVLTGAQMNRFLSYAASATTLARSGAHGICGFDSLAAAATGFRGGKGGDLDTVHTVTSFSTGGLSYALAFNTAGPDDPAAAAHAETIRAQFLSVLGSQSWDFTDLFPAYGLPSLPLPIVLRH